MGEGKPGKRDLAVQIDKPSDQESTEEEQFPSPRPLYTPTAKEVDDTLENAMGAMRGFPDKLSPLPSELLRLRDEPFLPISSVPETFLRCSSCCS